MNCFYKGMLRVVLPGDNKVENLLGVRRSQKKGVTVKLLLGGLIYVD